ncbi:MAG TPA: BON domain-containing protein [Blastocatellia bacterium]|nr:BON domain-containing protein [Blastocatellia bacterium]
MKKIIISLVLCLGLVGLSHASQDNSPKKAAPVDCAAVDDSGITTGVKERLAKSPALKDAGITVETKDGVVTLKGHVKTGGLKGVATRITRRVDCVKKVDNQLSVDQGAKLRKETKPA